jgi:phage-related protein
MVQGIGCSTVLLSSPRAVCRQSSKPLVGFGSGVLELALAFRGDAYRVVCAVLLGPDVWVIHAFQKKSKSGIKTPKQELDLIDARCAG